MTRLTHTPGATWPALMRAKTAAAYVDETSVEAFRRRIGSLYPQPLTISGRGELWLRDDLDKAIEQIAGHPDKIRDAADVL